MSENVRIEIQDEKEPDQSVEKETVADEKVVEPEQLDEQDIEASDEDDRVEAKLTASDEKAQEYYDRLLRVSAEFDNYKKRTSREMQDVVRYANEKLIKELLTVVDNLERAIESVQKEDDQDDPVLQGVRLTLSEVEKILNRHHVEPVKALGEPFDPNFHQAMMQEESEDQPANTVIREMQKGYVLHDRLIRPAMVVVSKAKSAD